ncbi:MAG: polymer-forming cytoskeletal protein [Deltaproteobacteria bacterium]|nr:polymer-forming cytoskeletal protein [Deltaproteobacteria bacterium]MBI2211633.1 polymer-forming cytoskeletal protein [Deltaproteobacteria bacterium]MBI2348832.1 polymer-forming cytoskeletal protein [Deltaproteobacteria bacterium]MBI2540115.1 polymer-forming cytoskeletal protein [Deltaproteobacteria bacterium]
MKATKQVSSNPTFLQVSPRTVLSPGTAISGKLSFNLPVKIDSRFKGEVKATELLVVGANAQVEAKISARHLHIEGSLVGTVRVAGWIEILPGGRFQGEIEAGKLRVHPGGVFEGKGDVLAENETPAG